MGPKDRTSACFHVSSSWKVCLQPRFISEQTCRTIVLPRILLVICNAESCLRGWYFSFMIYIPPFIVPALKLAQPGCGLPYHIRIPQCPAYTGSAEYISYFSIYLHSTTLGTMAPGALINDGNVVTELSVTEYTVPDGATMADTSKKSSAVMHRSLSHEPLPVMSASGHYLRLSNDQSIFDASGGAAVACLGHGNERYAAGAVLRSRHQC